MKEWNYGICENCLKNRGKRVKMVREKMEEADDPQEVWCCPECGATKRL